LLKLAFAFWHQLDGIGGGLYAAQLKDWLSRGFTPNQFLLIGYQRFLLEPETVISVGFRNPSFGCREITQFLVALACF
jgi:hypothetical protein